MKPSMCNSKTSRLARPPFGPTLVMLLSLASLAISCTKHESNSLLQFLTGLSQDSGLSKSWHNATDCCTWEGIGCSPDKTVTDVLLASRSIQGFISPALGNLTGLLRLNLSYNLLSGDLPQELLLSRSIIILDVSFNQLNGGLQDLTSSISHRPLEVLNISSNLFSGRLPSITWEAMKNLAVLNASNNSFMGQIPSSFCVSRPYLAVLELSYNQFSGSIPPGIGNCSMLKNLRAGYNHLNGTLPDELFNVTLLEHLSFPTNNLEGSLNHISKLTNLITLDFKGNELHGNISDSIGDLKRLEEIHLDENNMSGELPPTLGSCKNLKDISLRSNSFSGELTRVNFSMLPNLVTLDLVLNNFSGTIPESIYSCSKLVALRLGANKFQFQHGQLSKRIASLKSLSFLSIGDSALTNITSALQILFHIDISNNSLTGEIPKALMEMPMLKIEKVALKVFELPIYRKQDFLYRMSGAFPKALKLGNNNLTGAIPPEIGELKGLALLDLSSNKLYGEIPQSICNLTSLQTLDLSANSFTGALPASLNKLHFLSAFNVSSNDLEGPIPTGGQFDTFDNSSYDGNPKLCGPLLGHDCNSSKAVPPLPRNKCSYKVTFVIGFSVFFGVGVMLDQVVLPRILL